MLLKRLAAAPSPGARASRLAYLSYLPTLPTFLLPAVVDVALAAALGGEPPRRSAAARSPCRLLTLPIDLSSPPPQWGEGGDSTKAQVPATYG